MIPESQYLFSLLVVLLLGIVIGLLCGYKRKVEYHYRHTWQAEKPDMSHSHEHHHQDDDHDDYNELDHSTPGGSRGYIDPELRKDLREIVRLLRKIFDELQEIEIDVRPKTVPQLFQGKVNLMPKTIPVGGTSLATLVCLDQNGSPFTLDATYTEAYSASAPADVTVGATNADGSATITGVAADPGDTIGCVITRPDGVAITAGTDVLTITPVTPPVPVLTSATVVLT